MKGAPAAVNVNFAHVKRLFPVVLRGRTLWLIAGELTYLFIALLSVLMEGGSNSEILKSTLIIPVMFLLLLCTCDLVPALRRSGELELAATLSSPLRMLVHRMIPALLVVLTQVVAVSVFLVFLVNPLHVLVGMAASLIAIALAASASLYWNLRLKGAGAVFFATFMTLLPFIIWIGSAYLVREKDNLLEATFSEVLISSLLCQTGVLMGACFMAALAVRRLNQPEKVFGD